MSTFTDQKPFVVTEHHCQITWGGGFMCAMCGDEFRPGDVARWAFTNDIKDAPGNPLICSDCDGADVIERWRAMWQEWRDIQRRFRWFARNGR